MFRSRFGLYWIVFLLSSLCLAGVAAGFVIKEWTRFREQARMTVTAQFVQSEAQLASLVDEVRSEATKQLASFHMEGLGFQLNKWANENDLIREVTIWTPESGFESIGARGEPSELIEALNAQSVLPWTVVWDEGGNLKSLDAIDDDLILGLESIQVRAEDADQAFGYLMENVALLEYEDIETAPYLGWWSSEHKGEHIWVFWHQLARGAQVRLFSLNLEVLGEQARQVVTNFVASETEVRLHLEKPISESKPYREQGDLGEGFPGWFLDVSMTEDGQSQESVILLTGGLVVGLFFLLISGGSLLIYRAHVSFQDMLQKTTFVSAVSHELKTPLTSIRLYAEMMGNETVETEKRLEYADTIHRESQRLTSLINNLLTFSSLEHGKRKYRKRSFDLTELVSLTVRDYDQTIRASGFDCELDTLESGAEVDFDESVVKLVLINLIENVLKHAKEGAWMGIRVARENGNVVIDVKDAGPGVEAGMRESIFEAFVQGNIRLDNKKSGTGLGLSIARSMMRDCGGDLILLEGGSSGATFRMIFQ